MTNLNTLLLNRSMLIVVLYTHGAWHSPVPRASCQIDLIFFPIFVPVPSQDLDFSVFPIPHVMVSFVVNVLRWVAVVSFVGTGGIVDHFCLNFPFINNVHRFLLLSVAELSKSLSCLSDNRSGRCGQCVRPIKHLPDLHIFYNFN